MGRLYDLLHSLVGDTKRTKADIEAVQNSIQNLSDTNAELKSDLANGNVGDASIKTKKLEGVVYTKSINLVSANTTNQTIISDNTIADSSAYKLHEQYIPITNGQTIYRLNTNGGALIGFYDENKNPIAQSIYGRIGLTTQSSWTFDIPSSIKYIRIADSNATANEQVWSFTQVSEYTPYGDTIDMTNNPLYSELDEKKVDYVKKYERTVISETNINFSTYDNKTISSNGNLSDYTGYATSDYIDLTNVTGIYRYGTTVKFGMTPYAYYDENKNLISRVPATGDAGGTDYEIVEYNGKQVTWLPINENAKYMRIVWQKSRPYTYVVIKQTTEISYDMPYITVKDCKILPLYGKTIVNFGDSIFGNFRDTNTSTDKSISKMIEEKTGAIVYNCGFGGCRMATHSNYWDAFSMHSIADSIASETWTVQENALVSGASALPAYFVETVELLKTIDFSEVDIITIGYGTNDYAGNVFVHGTEASFAEEWNYFKGALRYSIRTILNKYPHIKIVVISPCWRWFIADGVYSYSSDDDNSKNTRNYKLTDYVDMCETVCKEYHIPYIDTYYSLGFNEFTHLEYFPASDGTHPNQNGRQLRADRIIAQLLSLVN